MSLLRVLLLLGLPLAAFGYSDPGTGVFIYQAMFAGLIGLGWPVYRIAKRLVMRRAFLRRKGRLQEKSA